MVVPTVFAVSERLKVTKKSLISISIRILGRYRDKQKMPVTEPGSSEYLIFVIYAYILQKYNGNGVINYINLFCEEYRICVRYLWQF